MRNWRKFIGLYQVVSWLLISLLLVQLISPLHFHLHHHDHNGAVEKHHVIDSHVLIGDQVEEHHMGQDDHTLLTTPNTIVKKTISFLFTLSVCLLVLLLLAPPLVIRLRRCPQQIIKHFSYHYFAPPLRAPPLV